MAQRMTAASARNGCAHPGRVLSDEPASPEPLGPMRMQGEFYNQLPDLQRQLSNGPPQQKHSDRHPVTVEFMIFVVSALTSAKVREIVNELDCCDPFHHFEPELIFAAQP